MKIAVVGVGAMGAIYAGLLADAGHEVWAVDIWQDHIDAINANGLHITGASGERTVTSIRATTDIAEAGGCEFYIVATKASGVGSAARGIAPLAGPGSIVLTIQHGLGAGERIAEHMAIDNVLVGVADGFGACMEGVAHVHHYAMNLIRIGEINGGMTARVENVTKIWQDAGFNARGFEDINQLIWEKFICNCAYSAPCTVFGCSLGELMGNAANFQIALGCAKEAYALGLTKGIDFSFDDPVAYVTAFGKKMPDAKPSMLQDHEAERPSEIAAINGMAVILGKELAIATPYNEVLSAIVRDWESRFKTT